MAYKEAGDGDLGVEVRTGPRQRIDAVIAGHAKTVQCVAPAPEVVERLLMVEDDYQKVLLDPATMTIYGTIDGAWWIFLPEEESD